MKNKLIFYWYFKVTYHLCCSRVLVVNKLTKSILNLNLNRPANFNFVCRRLSCFYNF